MIDTYTIYFYGQSLGNYFLSNFFVRPFCVNVDGQDITFKTSEHYYQYLKMKDNEEYKKLILESKTPSEAKRLGHKGVCDIKQWDSKKDDMMRHVLKIKFQDPVLKKKLLETGDALLVEQSPIDYYWGCGKKGQVKTF